MDFLKDVNAKILKIHNNFICEKYYEYLFAFDKKLLFLK